MRYGADTKVMDGQMDEGYSYNHPYPLPDGGLKML